MLSAFYRRFAWWIVSVALLLSPLAIYGAARAVQSNTNRVEDWLPDSFQETLELGWFRQHFASDQYVLVSWPGCRIGTPPESDTPEDDDPRLEALAELLQPQDPAANTKSVIDSSYFKAVTTGRRLLNSLLKPPTNLPYAEAIRRLQGALIGHDGRQTCLVVTLPPNSVHFRKILGRPAEKSIFGNQRPPGELFKALELVGIPIDQVRLGGPPVDNVAIDEEGERTLVRLAVFACLIGLGLAWWSLRSIRMTLIVFTCGIFSAAVSMAIVWQSGQNMDAVLLSMPALVYVLAMSGSVHLVNYYRDAVVEHGQYDALGFAVAHGWKPALLCSITTAIGLGSLCGSQLAPIRNFGLYSAIGVMAMFVVIFVCLPALIQVCFGSGKSPQLFVPPEIAKMLGLQTPAPLAGNREAAGVSRRVTAKRRSFSDRLWGRCAVFLVRHHVAVSLLSVLFLIFATFGLMRVRTAIDLLTLFGNEARLIQDYRWYEEQIGPLVPLEIVLRFPRALIAETSDAEKEAGEASVTDDATSYSAKSSFLERMEFVSLCQQVIDHRHGAEGANLIGPSISPATFVPILPPPGGGLLAAARRSSTSKRLWEDRDAIRDSGYLRTEADTGAELWRVSLRAAAFKCMDYRAFLEDVQGTLAPLLLAQHTRQLLVEHLTELTHGATLRGSTVTLHRLDGLNAPTSDRQKAFVAALSRFLQTDSIRLQLGKSEEILTSQKTTEVGASSERAARPKLTVDVRLPESMTQPDVSGVVVSVVGVDASEARLNAGDTGATVPAERWMTAVYTGVVPICYKAQRTLLEGLINSTLWSFLTITPLMMFVCRSFLAGIVVMLPNTLPVLVVFGGMGWLKTPVDIGTMMAASIALGVAVDDTIHYLAWFRQDLVRYGHRRRAILEAYRRCANPTLQSALISGLGLSVFAFSTFVPTQRFGWLMLIILSAGVIAELVMLPALLAGPLGKVFRVVRRKRV